MLVGYITGRHSLSGCRFFCCSIVKHFVKHIYQREGTSMEIKATTIEMVPIEKLVDHPRNNNKHSDEQISRLAKLIQHTGFRDPLTVSKRSGFIIAGHCRKQAALKTGLTELPVC